MSANALSTIHTLVPGPDSHSFPNASNATSFQELAGNSYVLNTSLDLTGKLSNGAIINLLATVENPLSAKFITNNEWLVTSKTENRVDRIDPIASTSFESYTVLNSPWDAELVSTDVWVIADEGNQRVIKVDASTDTILWSYSTAPNEPTDVDIVTNDLLLITTHTSPSVKLVNMNTNATVESIISNIGNAYDAEYINDTAWLVVDNENWKVKMMNPQTDAIIWEYNVSNPWDVELLPDGSYLVAGKLNGEKGFFNLELPSGTLISSHTENVVDPRDAEYVGPLQWIITDKSGPAKASVIEQFYPTNLTLDIGNDSTIEWSYDGELNTTVTIDQNNLSAAINEYLLSCDPWTTCQVPLVFHSLTKSRLDLDLNSLTYDRRPIAQLNSPNGGTVGKIATISWTTTDQDNDPVTTTIYFSNGTDTVLMYSNTSLPGIHSFDWNTSALPNLDSYSIIVNVSDPYATGISDSSDSSFGIDTINPSVELISPNGGENISGLVLIVWNGSDNLDTNLSVSIEYSFDNGSSWTVIDNNLGDDGSENWDTSGLNADHVLLRVNVTDDAGNTVSDISDGSFLVDNVGPTIILEGPSGWVDTNTISFIFNVSDPAQDSFACELQTDESGVLQTVINVTAPEGVNVINHTLSDGDYVWLMQCSDGTNIALSSNRTITVDTHIDSPSFGPVATIQQSSATLFFVFDEPVTFTATFNNNSVSMTDQGSGNYSYDATGLSSGSYDMVVNATDAYNHSGIFTHSYAVSIPSRGGGGGGGSSCRPDWSCGAWGPCIAGEQTRTCVDVRNCYKNWDKPAESQSCVVTSSHVVEEELSVDHSGSSDNNTVEPEPEPVVEPEPKPENVSVPPITGSAVAGGFGSLGWGVLIGFLLLVAALLSYRAKRKGAKRRKDDAYEVPLHFK
ncbi:hypothetical protein GF342_04685 [Candidatus Woesearchaeota archaeon]|nr:hypothetical protein [Candidatus Woesearchaeota archaeon]